jgi:hypothetical protein
MGISEYKDGSSVPVKTGLGVMQNQIASSNSATEYIYDAYTTVMEETCEKAAMMLWDSVVLRAKKVKEFEGYDVSLIDMTFDVRVDLMTDDRQRAELQQLMNTAIQAGMLSYEQAFKIKNIEDTKLAELYLSRAVKRAKKEAEDTAQKNAEMNAKMQQQSSAQNAQEEAQLKQMETQGKIAINKSKGTEDKDIELLRFASSMYNAAFSSGKELPSDIKQIVDGILNNAVQEKVQIKQEEEQVKQAQAEQEGQQEQD